MEQTKQLLYDLQKRHDFWDMTRNIFPFGEAWSEIMTSWVRLMGQNPRVMRRAQQVIEGAREERQNFQVEGEHLPGFFYVDPVTNEEVFNYPGGGLLTNWMVGGGPFADSGPGSMQLTGRTQGLNLFAGNALPGVGPVIQIPASTMQPFANFLDNPDQKWLRELILPFGKTEGDNPVELIADSVLPAWMKKGMIAFWHGSGENERLYNNTVIDVYKAMVMGGAYSDATPEQAQAALAEAKKIARNIYIIRSLAQAVLPTGPSVRWDARDETGELWAFQTLATEYRKMQEENDYDEVATFNQFTEAFGLDPTLFVTPKTQSLVRRSTTEPGLEWEQRNPEVFDDFAFTAYYGRPDDPYEPFDYNAYINQLREKTRKGLTPEQWQLERNDTLGRIAYEHARRMVGPRTDPAAVAWLRGNRYAIMERYPGYNEPTVGVARTATRDQLIREFYLWETNETLAGTDAGQGVAEYLRARDQVILISTQEMGLTETGFRNAAKALQLRNWLRYQAAQIVMRHPDFGPVWDQVFSREIEEDALSPVQLTAEASGFLEPQGV
ncbi:MAG: hypothetical protein GWN97_22495 [Thermoplasmata archaeon]|nr:hypothetical protein [Thermoplasmata archaeon]NIT80342.1 hypothetical protein [Thermoplasmata archaeon]NIY06710.1 hypothetical protein [Thermoplasmata archaeon]